MKMSVKKELQEIFQDVFDEENLEISDKTTSEDIEEWDSFAQIQLIAAIEKQFGVRFQMNELSSIHNVGEMIHLIESRKEK